MLNETTRMPNTTSSILMDSDLRERYDSVCKFLSKVWTVYYHYLALCSFPDFCERVDASECSGAPRTVILHRSSVTPAGA